MTKDIKLFIRITEEMDDRIDLVIARLPGGKADFVRFAVDQVLAEYEQEFKLTSPETVDREPAVC